ncbi:YceI family protein [Ideonella sp. BN130291]|uniref:YceI family protein n=1 Tax=Ideonella sp. BN130291 TaxID=3112940 RepID=UPI002E2768F9|nr:YceI family protein [Ideonella sp. BN130291]
MKPLLFAALAVALSAPAFAEQKLLPAQSEVAFTSRQMGVPVDGKFRTFNAQVAFDPKKPEAAKIGITIDLASVSLGAPESEAELVKQPWFDTKKFPQASFQSTSVKATGAGKFDVAGKLAIKGNARDVVVPVTLAQAGGVTTASGTFVLKRLDFKIGEGEWADTSMVANDVQVKFKLALSGVGPL